jgi:hypothetical protein
LHRIPFLGCPREAVIDLIRQDQVALEAREVAAA